MVCCVIICSGETTDNASLALVWLNFHKTNTLSVHFSSKTSSYVQQKSEPLPHCCIQNAVCEH